MLLLITGELDYEKSNMAFVSDVVSIILMETLEHFNDKT